MFVIETNAAQPSAAFVSVAKPDATRITKLLLQNMMVRTLADADGVEARANDLTRATAAIQSGAQVVATDYPVADPTVGSYVVSLPTTAAARCDPVTAPKRCRDTDVENAARPRPGLTFGGLRVSEGSLSYPFSTSGFEEGSMPHQLVTVEWEGRPVEAFVTRSPSSGWARSARTPGATRPAPKGS